MPAYRPGHSLASEILFSTGTHLIAVSNTRQGVCCETLHGIRTVVNVFH